MRNPGGSSRAPGSLIEPTGEDRWNPPPVPAVHAPAFAPGPPSLWRYRDALDLPRHLPPVSLGEGFVPVEPLKVPGVGDRVFALRDDLEPTGSWKDRGSSVLVTAIAAGPRRQLVEDSSGNAALSLARYADAAGFELTLFVPKRISRARGQLLEQTSARVERVPGPREESARAAAEAAAEGALWASHVLQPLHVAGAATAAFNIYERLGAVPDVVIAPVGHGGLLTGLGLGFDALAAAGLGGPPRLVGVQARECAPLVRAFNEGLERAAKVTPPPGGMAEGVLIAEPGRAREVLAFVRASGGILAAADELALERALRVLWLEQVAVEPTAALPVAWLLERSAREWLGAAESVVVVLTGHGMRDGLSLVEGEW